MKSPTDDRNARAVAKLVLGVCVALLTVPSAVGASSERERDIILQAIHSLENPRNLTRPGRHGELGAYQFRASTWKMHTKTPFYLAVNRVESDVVAVRHYEWLKRGLERAKVPVTPYNIALAWNSGLAATIRGTAPRIAHDYAQRAANLTAAFTNERRVADAR